MASAVSPYLKNPFDKIQDLSFCKREAQGQGNSIIPCASLKESTLQASLSSEAGSWENRCNFINTLARQILSSPPSQDPITIISIGSSQLLMEFILLTLLMRNRFRNFKFIGIDPAYSTFFQEELQEFRKRISEAYFTLTGEEMPTQIIKFLSSITKVEKYFKKSCAFVLQCLPPHGEPIANCYKRGIEHKNPRNLFAGNIKDPNRQSDANAIMVIPPSLNQEIKSLEPQSTISLCIFANRKKSDTNYCLDWGCKILNTGELIIDFSGYPNLIDSIPDDKESDKLILNNQFAKLEETLKKTLTARIEALTKPLSKEQILELIKLAEGIVKESQLPLTCLRLEDYQTRFEELMTYLKQEASSTHVFTLVTDPKGGPPITNFTF